MDWDQIDNSPARIRQLLDERGLTPKKRWGQNYMIAPSTREKIVRLLDPTDRDSVWEIGPGLGSLTALIIERVASLTVFEIDWGMIRVVEDRFSDRISVVQGDAVQTLADTSRMLPDLVVGNLPYRSAAAIIGVLLERADLASSVRRIVVTVQREMARRMVAAPGSGDYSPFSILCALATDASLDGDIPHAHFHPRPNVTSSIVSLCPRQIDPHELHVTTFIARTLFAARRKMISNNLGPISDATGISAEELLGLWKEIGIAGSERAETLSSATFLEMARGLNRELTTRDIALPTPGEPYQ